MAVSTPKTFYFIRGLSRETRHWGNFLKKFSQQFNVKAIALELPSVGTRNKENSPRKIQEITDDLRNKVKKGLPYGLVSISMGGMIAMDWAARFPQEVSHLCIINSSAGNLSLPHQRLKLEAIKMISKVLINSSVENRERAALKLTCNIKVIDQEIIDLYAMYAKEFPLRKKEFFNQLYAAATFRVPKEIKQKDFLIFCSQNDRLVNSKCSTQIAKHFHQKLITHKKAGHDLVLDDPAWLLDKLKNIWFN